MAKIRPPLKAEVCTGGLNGVGGGGDTKTSSKTPGGIDASIFITGSGFNGIADGESGTATSIIGAAGTIGGGGGGAPTSTGMLGGIGCGGASTAPPPPVNGLSFSRGISGFSTAGAAGGISKTGAGGGITGSGTAAGFTPSDSGSAMSLGFSRSFRSGSDDVAGSGGGTGGATG